MQNKNKVNSLLPKLANLHRLRHPTSVNVHLGTSSSVECLQPTQLHPVLKEVSKKRILVTGGAGYIGSACVQELINEKYDVVIYDNFSTGQRDKVHKDAVCIEGDVLDAEKLNEAFTAHKIDAVIHFAAKKAVGESEENPELYFKNNVCGTISLLSAMAVHNVPSIIFSSTAAVYAPSDVLSFSENDIVVAPNVYGTTKHISETIIKEFARTGKIQNYSILRYFNIAGDAGLHFKERNPQNVFPRIAEALQSGKTFNIYGTDYPTKDGTCIRDYIHLSDLVAGHLQALEATQSGIYNLGTGTGYSVRELVAAFDRLSGKKLNVNEAPRRLGDPSTVTANPKHALNTLNWKATKTLDDMVQDTLDTYGV